jgi:hypothetical protein
MKKFSQNSIVDFLIENFPQFKQKKEENVVSSLSANKLFNMWKSGNEKISNNIYNKPKNMSNTDIEMLQKEGLVSLIGDKIQITSKGSQVIKTMILGDDRSSFDDDGNVIDYKFASDYTQKPSKLKKQSKKNFDLWWKRFANISEEKINFSQIEEKARKMTELELYYAIRDLREVIKIQEKASIEGTMATPKLSYYYDELHIYAGEKARRQKKI